MFSYTWSSLWGNYTGLTTTDQIDGGTTGRNSPDTTRSFDEPFYYFGANGKSNDGPLPTDRPSTFKGNVYYQLPWKGDTNTTTFGLFQVAYEGSPMSSFTDLGLGRRRTNPDRGHLIFGRGKWVNATTDATTGAVSRQSLNRRTPWFTQTDFNLAHAIKVNRNNEHQVLSFVAPSPTCSTSATSPRTGEGSIRITWVRRFSRTRWLWLASMARSSTRRWRPDTIRRLRSTLKRQEPALPA